MSKNAERARQNRIEKRRRRSKKRLEKFGKELGCSTEMAENLFKEYWAALGLRDPDG